MDTRHQQTPLKQTLLQAVGKVNTWVPAFAGMTGRMNLVKGLLVAWALSITTAATSAPVEPVPPPENGPVQLQVQKQGIPTVILYRQLQPQKFRRYQQQVAPVQSILKATWGYLKLLGNKPPSLQRLAAYNADVQLAWETFEKKVQPEERSYRSYQLMKASVEELRHMTDYAVLSTQAQETVRITAKAQAIDADVTAQHLKNLSELLTQLNTLTAAQTLLDVEQPY